MQIWHLPVKRYGKRRKTITIDVTEAFALALRDRAVEVTAEVRSLTTRKRAVGQGLVLMNLGLAKDARLRELTKHYAALLEEGELEPQVAATSPRRGSR